MQLLVGEDDASLREAMADILRTEGYRVQTASDAGEVLRRLSDRPDLVILDLHGISDEGLTQRLSELGPERPRLLIVSGDRDLPQLAARMGAQAHLAKPFDISALLEVVRRVVERFPCGNPGPDVTS